MLTEDLQVRRRELLVAGATLAAYAAASMVQGCGGSGDFNSLSSAAAGNGSPVPDPSYGFVQPLVLRPDSKTRLLDTTFVHAYATNQVGNQTVNLRSYNGQLTGPTLRLKPGDTLRILIDNQLPPDVDPVPPANISIPHQFNTTNLHTHGLHVSPQGNSDNVFVEIHPGDKFQYEYKIPANHAPGTYWYHPHKHGSSSMQLFSGMAGALIIEGGLDQVPEIAAARDIVYMMTELSVQPDGTVPPWTSDYPFSADYQRLLINGQLRPALTALSGEVIRLRVINASVQTTLPIQFAGHKLYVVALDGNSLPSMREVDSLEIPPAGRADVLLKCGAPGTYQVTKLAATSLFPDPAAALGTLVVLNQSVQMNLPSQLPPPPYPNITTAELTSTTITTLTFEFNSTLEPPPPGNFGNLTIDQRHFDPTRIDHTVPLNSVLEWNLVNNSDGGHPFHIHVNDFMVVSVNNVPLPEPEWHDTFTIPAFGSVQIRHRFTDFTGLFVLHCHILTHEDPGMMQTVNVV